MKTTEYISCKILKYQNPSSGIQRRDAIKDYTPQVPFNKMKWTSTPIQQPVLSQDNRSKWQHEQASKQADKGYNEYMEAKKTEQGLDRLNQFVTFTDYAGLATGVGSIIGKGLKSGLKHVLEKGIHNKMEKGILSDGYVNVGQYLDSNRGNSIETMGRNFVEYLNQPETIKRLKSIDDELGTDYLKGREWFLDQYNKGYVRFTPADRWTAGNSNTTIKNEIFLRKPDYRHLKTTIIRQDPDHVVGHELKHGIEDYLEVLQNPNITVKEYLAQHGKGKRLQKLFDKDNIRTWDEFVEAVRKDKPDASEKDLREAYEYLTQESEFSSNLHPLVEGNLKNGKSGVPNFKNVEELEGAINGYYYPYAKKDDPMMNVKTIYNYLVKDKERFRQILNKYGWGVATPVINANPKYNENE